jgi:hypothetical protein
MNLSEPLLNNRLGRSTPHGVTWNAAEAGKATGRTADGIQKQWLAWIVAYVVNLLLVLSSGVVAASPPVVEVYCAVFPRHSDPGVSEYSGRCISGTDAKICPTRSRDACSFSATTGDCSRAEPSGRMAACATKTLSCRHTCSTLWPAVSRFATSEL